MARKKKKSNTQKQRSQASQKKRQRRNQRVSRRPVGFTNDSGSTSIEEMLIQDAAPLAHKANPDLNAEGFFELMLKTALATEDLIEEPEFRDIGFEPLSAFMGFIEAAEARGYDADAFFNLDEDTGSDVFIDVLEELFQEILTAEIRTEIIDAVDHLWRRLRKTRRQKKLLPRVAALLSILQQIDNKEDIGLWATIGLVISMFDRAFREGSGIAMVIGEMQEKQEMNPAEFDALMQEFDDLEIDEDDFDASDPEQMQKYAEEVERKAKSNGLIQKFVSQVKTALNA